MPSLPNIFLTISCLLFSCVLSAQTAFTDITEAAGIDHTYKVYEGMFGGGICVLDYDKDGFEDLFVTGGMNPNVLYRNQGDGTFKNTYLGSGLELSEQFVVLGAVGADVDRNGWVDLFLTTITTKDSSKQIPRAHNLLFLNLGDGTFRDATAEFGLDKLESFSTGGNFGDFNADGYPDLYVGNYFHNYEGGLDYISDATIVAAHQTAEGYLLLNERGKRFSNVYEDYDMSHKGFSFGGVFTDYDKDGDQDLIVNNDFGYKRTPNLVLENQYPRKSFKDVAEKLELDLRINSMGTAIGDINDDGDWDYLFTNIRFNKFMLSRHDTSVAYVNMLKPLGLNHLAISWGANFVDFDHDGDLDLYLANGDLNPNCVPMANFYFDNNGGKFTEEGRPKGLADYGLGRGSVVFDLENDGDLDIFMVNQVAVKQYPVPSYSRLYRNDSTRGNWIRVALEGIDAETHGIGSRVEIAINGKRMMREIDGGGSSHLSQNSTIAHFGLGDATAIDSIVVFWTGGNRQVLRNPQINSRVTIQEIPMAKKSKSWNLEILALLMGLLAVVFLVRRKKKSL